MDVSEITFVYSDKSVEMLERLIDKFSELFHLNVSLEDMFYTGVFCKPDVYANYFVINEMHDCIVVPDVLVCVTSTPESRETYVRGVIDQIIRGKLKKPEWMVYVEANQECAMGKGPSTYLRLIPKESKYSTLGDAILNFLYSVNSLSEFVGVGFK